MTVQLEKFVDLARTYTLAEFMTLPDDGHFYELIEGRLVEMRGPGLRHGEITTILIQQIRNYTDLNPVGKAWTNMAFVLNPKNAPLPDVGYVVAERLASLDYEDAFPGSPDLAVEIVSRTDELFEIYYQRC